MNQDHAKSLYEMKLHRNDKCPCGSGRKVKKCHKEYLDVRSLVVQNNIVFDNARARHNEKARSGKTGYNVMSREEFMLYLQQMQERVNKPIQETSEDSKE